MDVAVLVGVIGGIASIIFGYIGYQRGIKKECAENGKTNGVLMSDIGYIKAGVDDLKRKQEAGDTRHYELAGKVTRIDESLKSAWYEIKDLKGGKKSSD